MSETAKVREYLRDNRERHVARIQSLIQQPTLPSEDRGVAETARMLASLYEELGCREVEIVPTAGGDGVWAYYDAGAPRTLVNYCMFDTKPPDATAWSVPPFSATRTRVEPHGEVILGCGARSRKGPYVSWLNALEALIATSGTLPMNVAFLAEGEENIGSPNYAAMVERYSERLEGAFACFSPGAAEGDGTLSVRLGYKGLIFARLRSSGAAWGRGPARRNAHGMAQVLVDSPSWHLVHALASLTDAEGRHVTVEGFYDQLQEPTAEERLEVENLVRASQGRGWRQALGGVGGDVGASSEDLSDVEAYLKYFFEPSFNLNGLSAGFTGPGGPVFSLPGEAWALFDIRVPRGYRTGPVIDAIRRHLQETGRGDVAFEVLAAHEPLAADSDNALVHAVEKTAREFGLELETQPYTAGGGPWGIYGNRFGMPVLFDVGIGRGGRAGAPDEFLVIDEAGPGHGLIESELWYARLLQILSQEEDAPRASESGGATKT